jgi:hypothetical protein
MIKMNKCKAEMCCFLYIYMAECSGHVWEKKKKERKEKEC